MTIENPLEIIKQQKGVIETQSKQIDQFKKQLDLQQKVINDLQKVINDLQEKLNINSKNSSLPPSRDLYKLKNENRKKSELNPGGQPGHKVNHRPFENPDKIVKCNLDNKCECGGEIKFSNKFSTHTKVELPEVKPVITRYILQKGRCKNCKIKKVASLPSGVSKDLLGPRAKTTIAMLTGVHGQSKKEVQSIFKNLLNFEISTGLISKTELKVSKKCLQTYESYKSELKNSEYIHADETGFNNKGKKCWAWICANNKTALFHINQSRGRKVLENNLMLKNYSGIMISDRFGAYNIFDPDKRQLCLAHIIRNCERFAYSTDAEVAEIGANLVKTLQSVFKASKSRLDNDVGTTNFIKTVEKIRRKFISLLNNLLEFTNSKQVIRVARRLLSSEKMMWKFAENTSIDATNNHAERLLRKIVLYRKKSLFVWSEEGARFIERIMSIGMTSQLRGENMYQNLLKIVSR